MAQLTINQHWFRWWLAAEQATSHHLNQRWPGTMTTCGVTRHSELTHLHLELDGTKTTNNNPEIIFREHLHFNRLSSCIFVILQFYIWPIPFGLDRGLFPIRHQAITLTHRFMSCRPMSVIQQPSWYELTPRDHIPRGCAMLKCILLNKTVSV